MGMTLLGNAAGALGSGVLATGCEDHGRGSEWFGLHLANQIAQGHIQNQVHGVAHLVGETSAASQRHLGDIGHRNGLALEAAASRLQQSVCEVGHRVERSASDTQRSVADVGFRVERSAADTQRQLCAVESSLGKEIAATQRQAADLARELAMQAERQTNTVLLQAEKHAHSIERQAETHASAAALAAAQNTAAIQAALAKCCCELEARILSEANATRALIQAGETQRLRDELENARRQLLTAQLGLPVARAAA